MNDHGPQCKDVPDLPILRWMARAPFGAWHGYWYEDNGSPMRSAPHDKWPSTDRNVLFGMPPEVPKKLVLAKMKNLIRRGLAAGCTCGCRGDFEITDKGVWFICDSELWAIVGRAKRVGLVVAPEGYGAAIWEALEALRESARAYIDGRIPYLPQVFVEFKGVTEP